MFGLSVQDSEFVRFVSLLVINERGEGVEALRLPTDALKTRSGLKRYRDANIVPTSSLTGDVATAPPRPVHYRVLPQ